MSWSNSWIGRRSGIKAAIGRYSATLSGQSKEEFEAVRPHLEALLDLNFNQTAVGDPIVHLDANGHAYRLEGSAYSQVSVSLKPLGMLVEEPAAPAEGSDR
jgi:hypothetical protein